METDSDLPMALQSLKTALFIFHDNHPFLSALILIIYASGVFIYSLFLCASVHDPRTIPWLPPVFLTDGILVCCCPLAAVLPVILWPLVFVCNILIACLQWFLAAPTFCGIRREAFIRPYRSCVGKLRQWGRDRRARKQRRALLPVTNGVPRHAPRTGYGTVNEGRIWVDREQYSSSRTQRMQYARQPPFQSDAASVRSVPPPYQE